MTNVTSATDADGIAVITWDMPGRSMNVISADNDREFKTACLAAIADKTVKGVVITSAKAAFIAGADLSMMEGISAGAGLTKEQQGKAIFDFFNDNAKFSRVVEKSGKPFVAAINGTALGGGFEICMMCHHRVVADDPGIQIGQPEVKVGLLPGGGGTQRMPRLIGAMAALPLLLEGKSLDPQAALKAGLVHKVVPKTELLREAKAYILGGGKAVQPWDEKGYKIPGGTPYDGAARQAFPMGNALLHSKTLGNYPAPPAIMSCVYEGLQVPIDAGLRIEARYMAELMMNPASRNMIRSLFINMQRAAKLASRPKDVPEAKLKKIAVLGAGMMGAGIAYVSAQAGLDVVLIDSTDAAAQKGKAYSAGLLDAAIAKGRSTPEKKAALLARITPTTSYAGLADCDLVIEAVFEDRAIKADVTKLAEAVLPSSAIFASNTSTLPITGLAEASRAATKFIGVHFFSPVDKMQLVEIIRGKATSNTTLAVAMDYVKRIRKTPIVVNDSRGFYTSRVFATYTNEGIMMLAEGITPALIENAGRMTGMPMAPLALGDEVAIDLMYKVGRQTQKDLGDAYRVTPAHEIIDKMVNEFGRLGKKAGKGFYEYPEGEKKRLWSGLSKFAKPMALQPDVDELKTRFLYIQALEAARCYEEKVVTAPEDADIGAILGWGFAPWSGGPLSLIDTVGPAEFVARCDLLAQRFGQRFSPPSLLRQMAASGRRFYDTGDAKAA